MRDERIRRCFDPFRHIAVLENTACERSRLLSGCHPKIPQTITGLRALDAVIERLPLIGNEPRPHGFQDPSPESILYLYLLHRNPRCILFFIHIM